MRQASGVIVGVRIGGDVVIAGSVGGTVEEGGIRVGVD
jgi:hypothetical protein